MSDQYGRGQWRKGTPWEQPARKLSKAYHSDIAKKRLLILMGYNKVSVSAGLPVPEGRFEIRTGKEPSANRHGSHFLTFQIILQPFLPIRSGA
jgi:hypothetical protein